MSSKIARIVVDLGFGDAGKGSIVDYLARMRGVSAVVRFNGGAQAAHNVLTPDGRHHTFRQFGSATFVPGVRTHLSRFMLVNPLALYKEALELEAKGCGPVLKRLSIDADALVTTPYHIAANILREAFRGGQKHGTCAMGIGETASHALAHPDDAVRVRDLLDKDVLVRQCRRQQERFLEELGRPASHLVADYSQEIQILSDVQHAQSWAMDTSVFARDLRIVDAGMLTQLASEGHLIFEGAQGVLLDEWYGFHPHTTWSTTTPRNAKTLLEEIGFSGEVRVMGVLRAFHTRHGAGPLPTEDAILTQSVRDKHNDDEGPQGLFRVGWFDAMLARYASRVCGNIDEMALTHLDRYRTLACPRKIAVAYACQGHLSRDLPIKNELTDLVHQELLTEFVRKARVQYETLNSTDHGTELIERVWQEVGAPVRVASYGPCSLDKKWLASTSRVFA